MAWGPRTKAEERYQDDVVFRTLVDTLYIQIETANFTPTELREACHLAACMYEYRHIKPIVMDKNGNILWERLAATQPYTKESRDFPKLPQLSNEALKEIENGKR